MNAEEKDCRAEVTVPGSSGYPRTRTSTTGVQVSGIPKGDADCSLVSLNHSLITCRRTKLLADMSQYVRSLS